MNTDKRQVLSDIADVIHVVSDHIPPSEKIGMDTTLVADLALESIEVAHLFAALSKRYAGIVSVADFILEVMDTGVISDLPVGAIVDFVADSLQPDHIGFSRDA
jgi:acyl carrier protein